jgi:hypothetical protein
MGVGSQAGSAPIYLYNDSIRYSFDAMLRQSYYGTTMDILGLSQ